MDEFAGIVADSLFAGGSLVVLIILAAIVLLIWKPWSKD